jgi:hypothetical protein
VWRAKSNFGDGSSTNLANLIGRSQGQPADALRGHDPISGTVINRLRDILLLRICKS